MIEQTELVVTKWEYKQPVNDVNEEGKLTSYISLDVMKKRNAIKKGIACRFTCEFAFEKETILEYTAEDSYVIDFEDVIDKQELQRMLQNTYSKFQEKFDLRKLGTVLQDKSLIPFDDKQYDLDPVLLLLV
jgi:hypothetical protein